MSTSLSGKLQFLFSAKSPFSATCLPLYRGFAAQASTKALETVHSLSAQYLPIIEEDSIVSIDGDLINGGHAH